MPAKATRTKPSSRSPIKSADFQQTFRKPIHHSFLLMTTTATPQSATGRRKTAVARVWLSEGTGQIEINGRPFEEYLPSVELQNAVIAPFQAISQINKFDVRAVVKGGGTHGQAIALRHAISRALTGFDGEHRAPIKAQGYLTRDPRMKECKKSGQPGARKRFQFSKR